MVDLRTRAGRRGAASGRVLARHRQELILTEVRRLGSVRVSELTDLLGVSDMTIRRDLDVLAGSGLIDKVHGGATAIGQHSAEEPGFEVKSHRQLDEKRAIAKAAAETIEAGSAVGLTAGTTTWLLASYLSAIDDLVVVTNSVQVADTLHRDRKADRTVVLVGGVRTPSDALVGPVTVSALRGLHVDQLFMGVHGMSERAGFTTPNLLEAETNRAFLASSEQLVVLADHTKWGMLGLCTIASLDEADLVISDNRLSGEGQESLSAKVGRLLVVDVRGSGEVSSADELSTS